MPDNYRDPNYVTRRGGGVGGREERELDEIQKWERFWVGVGELWNALTEEEKDILLDGGDLPDDINERY